LPGSGNTGNICLPSQSPFGANLTSHACYFTSECVQLVDHRVDGVFEQENFAAYVHRDLLRKVAAGDSGRNFSNVPYLSRQVACHKVNRIRKVFPGSCNARYLRLTTQLAFGSDFASYTRYLACEGVELIDHRIDGVLQLKNFTLNVD